ncbi:hypothetical protein POJ06DRAFT_85479 [Lipomyces tetrasporus]|uniref:Uncharacterized protein n=1 Tax=Lipomyces tetrasporus TaxID=54092 RepID=A0AAD7VU96_9ASCO|nr:uncharacterized protein POJ06DRAFT_85479 [Lipomyces tetrasporus]KAJ8100975.1 hypothetical protein POJ06DRAFT_85479 [Lipomyces tetrasporus]
MASPTLSDNADNAEQSYTSDSNAGGFQVESPKQERSIRPSSASAALSSVFSPDFDGFDLDFLNSSHVDSPQLQSLPANAHTLSSRLLSSAQQSKLINYLDEQLLHISRKFVRKFSDTGPPDSVYYTIEPLLDDLSKLVDLIWYSVSSTSTPFIQSQYLLRIADDLNDSLPSLPINSPEKVFLFLRKLDKIFHKLIVGDVPSHKRMNNTEKMRLESIVERTRVDIVAVMVPFRGHELDITRVYEAVLEELN